MAKKYKPSYLAETYKNMSFADAAEAISKKYKLKDVDLIQRKSFQLEMEELQKLQEMQKLEEEGVELDDSRLPQHETGSFIKPLTSSLISALNSVPIGDIPLAENPWKGSIQPNIGIEPLPTLPLSPITPQGIQPLPTSIPNVTSINQPALETRTAPFQVNVDESKVSTKPGEEPSAYLPAYIGQGLSTALNLGILAGGYDKEAPIDNPYEQEVKRLANQSIDTTQQRNQILSAYNASLQNIGNARSANVRNALQANLAAGTADSLATSKLGEQQANLNLRQNYANTLNQLGMQKAQAQQVAQELTARNKGQFLSNVSAVGANLAESGKFFTEKKLNSAQNQLMADILNSKYSTVGINPDLWLRLKEGKTTEADILALKNTYGEKGSAQIIEGFKLKSKDGN